jgi:SAM-dependent methyltransferase
MTPEQPHDETIKAGVREHYGAIAAAPEKAPCCGPAATSCCGPAAPEVTFMLDGYTGLGDLGIADLGLGCGTPASFAGLAAGQTVLDLGSGAGIDVFIATKEIGPLGKAIGVDMTGEMIERARKNAATLGVANAEFRLGEIEHLPVATASVDRILSNCVLNLVPDKRAAFREMFRVLKPGGSFAVSDVVTTGLMPAEIRSDAALYAACVSGAIDRDEYLGFLRETGFSSVTVVREQPYPHFSNDAFGILSITVTGVR